MRLCDAYMRHRTGSWLVMIVTCRLLGVKPFLEPVLIYGQLCGTWKQISVKFEAKYNDFHQQKYTCKRSLQNNGYLGLNVVNCVRYTSENVCFIVK